MNLTLQQFPLISDMEQGVLQTFQTLKLWFVSQIE